MYLFFVLCLLTIGICSLAIWSQFTQHIYILTLPPILNPINYFLGLNFFFFLERVNVASSTDLGILLSDILNMMVAKSELGEEMFNEQFCMCFV